MPALPPDTATQRSHTLDSASSLDEPPPDPEDDRGDRADLSDSASEGARTNEREAQPPHDGEDSFVPPDDELVKKIIDQVEFYFSDVNITKDAFLLKHVKRNKEGYVSLKLISSFKRVKHLAKDWRVVAYALAKSDKLEINEAKTKLRRIDPLPAYDQTAPSRTVVAIDLPLEKPTIENVAEMFKSCGEIALIRILRPGNPIPADVRNFVNKHPEMNGTVSALIEFVRTESAHNAIQKEWSWRRADCPKVVELNAPPTNDKKKKLKKIGRTFDFDYASSCQSGSEAEDRRTLVRRRCSSPRLVHTDDRRTQRRWSGDSGTESSSSYSRSRSNRMSTDSGTDSYGSRSRSNSGISLSDVRRFSVASKDSDCCCCHSDFGRRGSLGKDSGSEGYGSSRSRCDSGASDLRRNSMEYYCPNKERMKGRTPGENVVRMPRGPDGGRGFLPVQPTCHTLVE
ncbi:hypothetical protein AAG570_012623 [Ranatra chinensis]|uniref:La-related protein 6 n=1 Tax=Ranatra chinensis TaxID=642074 RepID=A0ABD0YEE1_9HEMI